MACDHQTTITTQDGTRICRQCFASVPPGLRVPNSFVPGPATALDVTAISIAVFFGSLLAASAGLGAICARQIGWL